MDSKRKLNKWKRNLSSENSQIFQSKFFLMKLHIFKRKKKIKLKWTKYQKCLHTQNIKFFFFNLLNLKQSLGDGDSFVTYQQSCSQQLLHSLFSPQAHPTFKENKRVTTFFSPLKPKVINKDLLVYKFMWKTILACIIITL